MPKLHQFQSHTKAFRTGKKQSIDLDGAGKTMKVGLNVFQISKVRGKLALHY